MSRVFKGNRGITLMETLFSVALMSLVIVCVLYTFVQTIDISKRVNLEYAATNLAKNRMDAARNLVVTSGLDGISSFSETDTVIDSSGADDASGDFKRSTTVTPNYDGNANLVKVDVEVAYKYRGVWKEAAPTTMTTVLTDLEQR